MLLPAKQQSKEKNEQPKYRCFPLLTKRLRPTRTSYWPTPNDAIATANGPAPDDDVTAVINVINGVATNTNDAAINDGLVATDVAIRRDDDVTTRIIDSDVIVVVVVSANDGVAVTAIGKIADVIDDFGCKISSLDV